MDKSKFIKWIALVLACSVAGITLLYFHGVQAESTDNSNVNSQIDPLAWQPKAIAHAQQMKQFKDTDLDAQPTPVSIPKFSNMSDLAGTLATFQPSGPTATKSNSFFQALGTNQRTCFTCHQPQAGWSITPADVKTRFETSGGKDPIFRLVDGATCPSDDISTQEAKQEAFSLLINEGLIRIGLPLPAAPALEFEVTSVDDPYNCTTNPVTGLTSKTNGIVSVYRRPLPSTNLGFLSTIMWDGREPTLLHQALVATLAHAQGNLFPTASQLQQIVDFENGLFTAQDSDLYAKSLFGDGATGGAKNLYAERSKFYIGVNDPFGNNPKGIPFTPIIFNLYDPWENLLSKGSKDEIERRKSIVHGQSLFNNTSINITNVMGLNDGHNLSSIQGSCGTCHDTPSVGAYSIKNLFNTGVADAGEKSSTALDISSLPVFTLTCTSGRYAGRVYTVTDPGRAIITGKCEDIGKFKSPTLRGLAGRAPYFHNGSAATLLDVVNFYDRRFNIGFTDKDKQDLVNFLNTL
jgi:cytochrome c peroxidase